MTDGRKPTLLIHEVHEGHKWEPEGRILPRLWHFFVDNPDRCCRSGASQIRLFRVHLRPQGVLKIYLRASAPLIVPLPFSGPIA